MQEQAEVLLFSELSDQTVRRAHLEPCHDIARSVAQKLRQLGPEARIAVLPQGPLTIPYVQGETT